jgi:hypothetical protein
VARLLRWNMTVAGNHNRKSGCFGFDVQPRQVVQHVNGNPAGFEHLGFRQLARPSSFVDIAPHGSDRRNRRKRFKDLERSDISGVNDVFGPAQSFDCLGAQQTMRIGDDAENQLPAASCQFLVASLAASFVALNFCILAPHFDFIFSTNFPMLTIARPTVPRPTSWTSSRAVTRSV